MNSLNCKQQDLKMVGTADLCWGSEDHCHYDLTPHYDLSRDKTDNSCGDPQLGPFKTDICAKPSVKDNHIYSFL